MAPFIWHDLPVNIGMKLVLSGFICLFQLSGAYPFEANLPTIPVTYFTVAPAPCGADLPVVRGT